MIEMSRVRVPAGVAGEFSSPGATSCADCYPRITAVVLKRLFGHSGHSAKSVGGMLQLRIHASYVIGFEYSDSPINRCRTCAKTAAVSRGTSHASTWQSCDHFGGYLEQAV